MTDSPRRLGTQRLWRVVSAFVALFLLGVASLVLVWGLWHSSTRLSLDRGLKASHSAPLAGVPRSVVELMTLGHHRVYEDWLLVWLVEELAHQHQPDELARLVMEVLPQKPRHLAFYLAPCLHLTLQAQRSELCLPIMEGGMEALPSNWKLPLTLGYLYTFVRKQAAQGSYYYFRASQLPEAPAYAGGLARKIMDSELSRQDYQEAWRSIRETWDEEMLRLYFEGQTKAK